MSDAVEPPDAAFLKRVRPWTPHWSHQRVHLTRDWGMKPDHKPVCRASVHDDFGVGFHQCLRVASAQSSDGLWWCGTHSPAAWARREEQKRERQRQRDAQWAARRSRFDRQAAREKAIPALLDALRQIADGHNDARSVARAALAMWPSDQPEETK